MAQTILYYPRINIEDGAWLRNAILYWDDVSSIVPYENYEGLSAELLYLQNLGVYNAVYPQDLFHSEYAEDFCKSIVKRITAYDRTITKNPFKTRNECVRIHRNKVYAPALYELIHHEKIPQGLLTLLEDKRFIHDYNDGGWMEIDSKVAQIYMRTLAEYAIKCSDIDIVLGTDTATHNREIYSNARDRMDMQAQCCKINIEKCLPQPAMDVGYEDILNFKAKRKDELCAFREKIRELEANIYNADSPERIKHYENQFIENWQQCSNDFYRVLKEARVSFFLSSMVSLVAIPYVGQQLSQTIGPNRATAIQTGSLLLKIGVDYLNYKNKISPAKTDGGFSYIIQANRDGIIHI